MKIIEKFEYLLITKGCDNFGSKQNYSIGTRDNGGFYLINFHPSGEPEAFICCVAKGSNQSSLFELRPDRVKNYDVTLRRLAYESLRLVQNPGHNLSLPHLPA
jgi:hypothetical protein